jgi:hypothetical protein
MWRRTVLMAATLWSLGSTGSAVAFTDTQGHWASPCIDQLQARGKIAGYPDGTFRPNQAIPRTQAIAVLAKEMRYADAADPEAVLTRYFEDAAEIPGYARAAIATATVGRLAVNGPNVRQFRPNQNTTRGEVAALLCQAMGIARTLPLDYIAAGDQFAIPPEAGGRRPFSEGLAVAEVNGQFGYIDTEGNLAIRPRYDRAGDFKQGFALVVQSGQPGFINRAGALVTPPVGYVPATEDLNLTAASDGLWLRAHNARTIEYMVGIGLGQVPEYSTTAVGGIWGYFSTEP